MKEISKVEEQLLKKVYNSAGGLLRSCLRTEEQYTAAILSVKGKLIYQAAPWELGFAYDQWYLPYGTNLDLFRLPDHPNDKVNQAVLWNDRDGIDDDEWLEGERGEDDDDLDDYYDDDEDY